jgi:BolA protein
MSEAKLEEADIVARIAAAHPGATIDVAGADCNFEVYVISEGFAGIKPLDRQKSILALFRDEITGGTLHALSVKARTPQEQSASAGLVQLQL